jgi:hypothetical protein
MSHSIGISTNHQNPDVLVGTQKVEFNPTVGAHICAFAVARGLWSREYLVH